MSRRKQRAREAGGAGHEAGGPGGAGRAAGGAGRGGAGGRAGSARRFAREPASRSSWGLGLQIGFAVAVFALAVLVAELAGAANLGVSFGIGQIAFAIAVTYLLVWR